LIETSLSKRQKRMDMVFSEIGPDFD